MAQRILVFTDSRGELKKAFPDQPIYTERLETHLLARGDRLDLMLCPFKWTTTLDFIELIERGLVEPRDYDRVVLHCGIVEWSPRNESNFFEVLRGDDEPIDPGRLFLRGRRPRFANNKLRFFREFFGAAAYDMHCERRYDTLYRGESTASLISPSMLAERVIPYLKDRIGDDRLIGINANRILPGWDGNYLTVNPDGRPANIGIIERYAAILRDGFSNVIDLLSWSDEEVKTRTVDNMHFSFAGSEWLYEELVKRL